MRNNAQKHLRRGGFAGGGGALNYEFSQKYLDRFYGGTTINAMACIVPELFSEDEEGGHEGGSPSLTDERVLSNSHFCTKFNQFLTVLWCVWG